MSLITISRSIGSGAETIARHVAEGLQLEFYDDFKLQQEAQAMGLRPEELKSLDEKAPGFFDTILSRKPELYLDLMESVIYEVAKRGRGIILGHGSQMLLREFGCALHVLVYASEATRINNMMVHNSFSRKFSEKMIHKADHRQRGFFRFAFHQEWNDPALYDLTINTEKLGPEAGAELIMTAARAQAISACSATALNAMDRLALVKKIEAVLLENEFDLYMLHIEVPVAGQAHISGLTHSRQDRERLAQIVKQIPGISQVQTELSVMPAGY